MNVLPYPSLVLRPISPDRIFTCASNTTTRPSERYVLQIRMRSTKRLIARVRFLCLLIKVSSYVHTFDQTC